MIRWSPPSWTRSLRHSNAASAYTKDRAAAGPAVVDHAVPFVFALGGETLGKMLVVVAQDVDGEMIGGVEIAEAVGLAVEAEQHQRRVERDRAEGTGGEPAGPAVGSGGGDDSDAGGETAQRVAEGSAVDRHVGASPVRMSQ